MSNGVQPLRPYKENVKVIILERLYQKVVSGTQSGKLKSETMEKGSHWQSQGNECLRQALCKTFVKGGQDVRGQDFGKIIHFNIKVFKNYDRSIIRESNNEVYC